MLTMGIQIMTMSKSFPWFMMQNSHPLTIRFRDIPKPPLFGVYLFLG